MDNEFNGNGTMCGGGSGGSDWQEERVVNIENAVSSVETLANANATAIDEIQSTIQTMGGDNYCYIPLSGTEALMLKGANYIDTGLTMDGNTKIIVTGSLPDTTKQAVLVGAYKSNAERTVLKILGKSQKIQSQWASNVETTDEQVAEMDFSKVFYYEQDPRRTYVYCNGANVALDNSGYTGSDDETPLLLFNQTKSGDFNNGALHSVIITRIENGVSNSYGFAIRAVRKYKKSDLSFVGYSLIMVWTEGWFLSELPLPDGAYFELYETTV